MERPFLQKKCQLCRHVQILHIAKKKNIGGHGTADGVFQIVLTVKLRSTATPSEAGESKKRKRAWGGHRTNGNANSCITLIRDRSESAFTIVRAHGHDSVAVVDHVVRSKESEAEVIS